MTSDPAGRELPVVPRARLAPSAIVLGVFGALIVGSCAWVLVTSFELRKPERDQIPASVRAAHGNTRQSPFWHSGYHGGK